SPPRPEAETEQSITRAQQKPGIRSAAVIKIFGVNGMIHDKIRVIKRKMRGIIDYCQPTTRRAQHPLISRVKMVTVQHDPRHFFSLSVDIVQYGKGGMQIRRVRPSRSDVAIIETGIHNTLAQGSLDGT